MIEPFDIKHIMEGIRLEMFEETRYLDPSPCADEIARLRQMVEGLRNEIELDWSPQVDKLSMQVIQLEAQAATVTAERDELRKQLKDARDELSVYRLASETAMYEAGEFDASLFLSGDRGVEDVMRRVLQRLTHLEQLNVSTHELKEGYKKAWIEWSGKAFKFRRLFKRSNKAKRYLRKAYHKAMNQSNELYQSYSMALDDIGKIGEALGLNSSSYMTHSPRQVAEMVLKKAQSVTIEAERDELALWKRRAEAQLKITEAAINLTLTPLYEMQAANGAYYVSPGHYERLRAACREFKQLAESEAGR